MKEVSTADLRKGESWEAFLQRYRIRGIEGEGLPCTVVSESGGRYTVDRTADVDRYDGGMIFRWRCNCPAKKRCRHIDAVENALHAEAIAREDYDALEIIERGEC